MGLSKKTNHLRLTFHQHHNYTLSFQIACSYRTLTYHSTSWQMLGKFDNGKVSFANGFYDAIFADVLYRLRGPCSSWPWLTAAWPARWLSDKTINQSKFTHNFHNQFQSYLSHTLADLGLSRCRVTTLQTTWNSLTIPWRFAALLRGTQHVKFYSYHVHTNTKYLYGCKYAFYNI